MNTEIDMHPAQAEILRNLLFVESANYSKLNTTGITSDHFNFHIKRLKELDLVKRNNDGSYSLTKNGKEFANKFDTDTNKVERQPKLAAHIVCVKEENGKRKYLMQIRLKQPYYGFLGFVGGKVRWGERMEEAAARELREETGLKADLKWVGINHKMDYDTEGKLLEDKYFCIHIGNNAKGEYIKEFEGGKNAWLSRDEILSAPKLIHGVEECLDLVDEEGFKQIEQIVTVEEY